MIARALTATSLLVVARLVAAQELRGTVVDSASRAPVSGAVILLLRADGRQLGRNITNERGQYRIAVTDDMKRARFLRIGFRPREVVIPQVIEGVARLDVALTVLPQFLEPVHVVDQSNCPTKPDRSAAFALWEQARAGLLATVVARESNPGRMTIVEYRRLLAGVSDSIVWQIVHRNAGAAARGFAASYPSSEFLQTGFITLSRDRSLHYYGPDAEVLLDDVFTTGYCLSIAVTDGSRPNQIGLQFVPARRRPGRVDIAGALWIDTTARAVRGIDFTYLGLEPPADRYRPGGQITFREMANGVVLLDRWWIRMTGARIDTTSDFGAVGRRLMAAGVGMRALRATEGGGEVAHAIWPDGTRWAARLGTLRLEVVDREGASVSGIRVQLDSTDYTAVSDSSGEIELTDLLPGPYAASIVDSTLATIGIVLPTRLAFTAMRDSTILSRVVVRTGADSVRRACDATSGREAASFMVIARIVTSEGHPFENAEWELRSANMSRAGRTSSNGLLQHCAGLGLGSRLEIRVWRMGGQRRGEAPTVVTQVLQNRLTAIKIAVTPP